MNFAEKEGEDCLAANVEFVLNEIREKYARYGITEAPFVIVKADAGTYGMGIMTVKSVDDVREPQPQDAQQDGDHQGRPAGAAR